MDMWIRLEDLPPGSLFETQSGIRAVKSEYHYSAGGQCMCVLLASGEYAHFADGNDTLCRLTDAPPPLDMPDGPGWWAWEGYIKYSDDTLLMSYVQREVVRVYWGSKSKRLYGKHGHGKYTYGIHPTSVMVGKWYRLHMPWDKEATNE